MLAQNETDKDHCDWRHWCIVLLLVCTKLPQGAESMSLPTALMFGRMENTSVRHIVPGDAKAVIADAIVLEGTNNPLMGSLDESEARRKVFIGTPLDDNCPVMGTTRHRH